MNGGEILKKHPLPAEASPRIARINNQLKESNTIMSFTTNTQQMPKHIDPRATRVSNGGCVTVLDACLPLTKMEPGIG